MTDKTLRSTNGAPSSTITTASPPAPRPGVDARYLVDGKTRPLRSGTDPGAGGACQGSGAYGTFAVTHDISAFSKADLFNAVGKQTLVFLRFSTVAGEKGAADAERDVRAASPSSSIPSRATGIWWATTPRCSSFAIR